MLWKWTTQTLLTIYRCAIIAKLQCQKYSYSNHAKFMPSYKWNCSAGEDFCAFEGPRISRKLIYQRFSALLDSKITQQIQNVDLYVR